MLRVSNPLGGTRSGHKAGVLAKTRRVVLTLAQAWDAGLSSTFALRAHVFACEVLQSSCEWSLSFGAVDLRPTGSHNLPMSSISTCDRRDELWGPLEVCAKGCAVPRRDGEEVEGADRHKGVISARSLGLVVHRREYAWRRAASGRH